MVNSTNIKQTIKKLDIFSTTQFFRYRNLHSYGTFTGGVITLVLFCIFVILLITSLSNMINCRGLIVQNSVNIQNNPKYLKFNQQNSNLIFVVGISGINLNYSKRYFDLNLIQIKYQQNQIVKNISYPMTNCNDQQLTTINKFAGLTYNNSQFNNYLCFSPSLALELNGKQHSSQYDYFKISLTQCKNEHASSLPCANSTEILSVPYYAINFAYINSIVNPYNDTPINNYLEDRNTFIIDFSKTTTLNLYIKESTVHTDNRWMFGENDYIETGISINHYENPINTFYNGYQYFNINFKKSPEWIIIKRSYQKLDIILSYIGGLFAFSWAIFFIMNYYSKMCYELQMAKKMFPPEQKKNNKNKNIDFNLFVYIVYLCYNLISKIGFKLKYSPFEEFTQITKKVTEQLNISIYMSRIKSLQKCINILFNDHQLRLINLQNIFIENYPPKNTQQELKAPLKDEQRNSVQNSPKLKKPILTNILAINKKINQKQKPQIKFTESFFMTSSKINGERIQRQQQKGQQMKTRENTTQVKKQQLLQLRKKKLNQYEINKSISQCYEQSEKQSKKQKFYYQDEFKKIFNTSILVSYIPKHFKSIQNYETLNKKIDGNVELKQKLQLMKLIAEDLQKIEKQALNGDRISQKIFNKLITENLLNQIQKFDKTILSQIQIQTKKAVNTETIDKLQNKITPKKNNKQIGLQICLQTNQRLDINQIM